MSDWHGREWVDLGTELLDHQIVARNEQSAGKVDDLELRTRPDGRLEVQALVVGTAALLPRIGWARVPLRWLLARFGGPDEARTIPLDQVTGVDSAVHVTDDAAGAVLSPTEQRLRQKVIRRIPGGGHASW
ncbi:hypothetical protein SAMN05216266_110206 [Amycolatopsis marina]|uniref:PRC-barrel domain-containing protein n=1 Tax=Amycolatopsis marina TaxID=490629 RepID=A0A1I1AVA0_9PSEU|nr:hypothetical protein [Amycolatopsis marina]SFB41807.1 hypothetical protein SAMN05216266_110206 [Amycolatopsis marina]